MPLHALAGCGRRGGQGAGRSKSDVGGACRGGVAVCDAGRTTQTYAPVEEIRRASDLALALPKNGCAGVLGGVLRGLWRSDASLDASLPDKAGVELGDVVEVILDGPVALAGLLLQGWDVQKTHVTARVTDGALQLEGTTGTCDRRPCRAEHFAEDFVRQGEFVTVDAIRAEQKPAGQPGMYVVLGVAAGGLHRQQKLRLHIAQGELMEVLAATELALGVLQAAGKAASGDLRVDAIETLPCPHQGRDADDGLVAERADFDLGAIFEGVGNGGHALLDKEEVVYRLTGKLNLVQEFELDPAKLETLNDLGFERFENGVLVWGGLQDGTCVHSTKTLRPVH